MMYSAYKLNKQGDNIQPLPSIKNYSKQAFSFFFQAFSNNAT